MLNTLIDNTTQYVYGGDLGGSLWRFDICRERSSQRLGRTSSSAGDQPITVRPELARVRDAAGNYSPRRLLRYRAATSGFGDLAGDRPKSSTEPQAIYAVKDTGGDLGVLTRRRRRPRRADRRRYGDATRSADDPQPGWRRLAVEERLVRRTCRSASGSTSTCDCSSARWWRCRTSRSTLLHPGGKSWLWALDYRTGAPVLTPNDKAVGFPVGNSIATGVTLMRLPTNKLVAIVTEADTTVRAMTIPVAPGAAAGVRRMGWREIL